MSRVSSKAAAAAACTEMSATNRFLVDNSELKAKSKGLAYRNSKDLLDRDVNSSQKRPAPDLAANVDGPKALEEDGDSPVC